MERDSRAASQTEPGLGRRLLWFAGLWLGGVAAVAVVGLIIKLMLGH